MGVCFKKIVKNQSEKFETIFLYQKNILLIQF